MESSTIEWVCCSQNIPYTGKKKFLASCGACNIIMLNSFSSDNKRLFRNFSIYNVNLDGNVELKNGQVELYWIKISILMQQAYYWISWVWNFHTSSHKNARSYYYYLLLLLLIIITTYLAWVVLSRSRTSLDQLRKTCQYFSN